ncbi:DUF808 domain-containing protein [Aureimonas fodinaquatilis]|uniref:DUF808 domain-containing protein n=1 Tax=Aureimonas fodinaquatilis TaxID=2565783 RepID=A0A5B0DYY8_9HYPH|nr:DUF808 domain-containing protein [Aureimonas fodinaquatilis]KAA0971743.1 DUF808 domain-containing protein [Aureimonas fodinaquatilis]
MATGLIALLDDVAAIAKVAAASLDDVVAQSSRAGLKAAGIVIDDTAVTPRYVVGFAADRELPIVGRIALGSLRNKLLFLLPAALALSAFAAWSITPLLMLGGLYLCYEGAEKVLEVVWPHDASHGTDHAAQPQNAAALEEEKVQSAIRTDFILSAEIMALTLATITVGGFAMQATVLAVVGILVTAGVYGAVALIVKADDAGMAMAASQLRTPVVGAAIRAMGRGLVLGMPYLLKVLAFVGTAAMLWVGGGILLHGLEAYGISGPAHWIEGVSETVGHAVPVGSSVLGWLSGAAIAGVIGLVAGVATIPVVQYLLAPVFTAVRQSGIFKRAA